MENKQMTNWTEWHKQLKTQKAVQKEITIMLFARKWASQNISTPSKFPWNSLPRFTIRLFNKYCFCFFKDISLPFLLQQICSLLCIQAHKSNRILSHPKFPLSFEKINRLKSLSLTYFVCPRVFHVNIYAYKSTNNICMGCHPRMATGGFCHILDWRTKDTLTKNNRLQSVMLMFAHRKVSCFSTMCFFSSGNKELVIPWFFLQTRSVWVWVIRENKRNRYQQLFEQKEGQQLMTTLN